MSGGPCRRRFVEPGPARRAGRPLDAVLATGNDDLLVCPDGPRVPTKVLATASVRVPGAVAEEIAILLLRHEVAARRRHNARPKLTCTTGR
jgi:hypothetical protein